MFDSRVAVRKFVLSLLWRSGLARLAEPATGGIGAILMLHSVSSEPPAPPGINRHLRITPQFLDAALALMKDAGFRFVTMDELAAGLEGAHMPDAPIAAISLDDGYRDNLREALPVFERHEAPFIVHVAPGLSEGAIVPWWLALEEIIRASEEIRLPSLTSKPIPCRTAAEKLRADRILTRYLTREIPETGQAGIIGGLAQAAGLDLGALHRARLMDQDEIRHLAQHKLAEIGAHTVHHYNLRRLDEAAARREIRDAAERLEDWLGVRPRHMAFPYGSALSAGAREARLTREAGFRTAVTTRHGILHSAHGAHLHGLPRISLNGNYQRLHYLQTMLTGVTTPMANRGRRVVAA